MREFVEYIARELVDKPDAVEVTEHQKIDKIVYRLKVDDHDVGKIIGKNGRTASAFRVLLSAVAAKHGHRGILEIID
jgi:uncharacterized protein